VFSVFLGQNLEFYLIGFSYDLFTELLCYLVIAVYG